MAARTLLTMWGRGICRVERTGAENAGSSESSAIAPPVRPVFWPPSSLLAAAEYSLGRLLRYLPLLPLHCLLRLRASRQHAAHRGLKEDIGLSLDLGLGRT